MKIAVSSLLRVLRGVAVATKAPIDFVQPLTERISKHGACYGANMRQGSSQSNGGSDHVAKRNPGIALSVEEWLDSMASIPGTHSKELCQLTELALGVAFLREKSRGGTSLTADDLDKVWSLVHHALTNGQDTSLQYTVSRSAQGFFAVPLCSLLHEGRIDELFRLHVWLPDGERGAAEVAIHSHQAFAQSWILAGSGTNHTYEVYSTDNPYLATHSKYIPRWSDGKQDGQAYKTHQTSSTVTNTGKLLRASLIGTEIHTSDMSYSIPGGSYHQTMVPSDKLHATLFYFDSHRGFFQDAGVLGPKDGRSYTQTRSSPGVTPSALTQMVAAIRSWEKSKNIRLEGNNEL